MKKENEKMIAELEETIQSIKIEEIEQQLEDAITEAFDNENTEISFDREALNRTKYRVAKEIEKCCRKIQAINANRLQRDFMLNYQLNYYGQLMYQPVLIQYSNPLNNHPFTLFCERLYQKKDSSFLLKLGMQMNNLNLSYLSEMELELYRLISTCTELNREVTVLQEFINIILQIENNPLMESQLDAGMGAENIEE